MQKINNALTDYVLIKKSCIFCIKNNARCNSQVEKSKCIIAINYLCFSMILCLKIWKNHFQKSLISVPPCFFFFLKISIWKKTIISHRYVLQRSIDHFLCIHVYDVTHVNGPVPAFSQKHIKFIS